MSAADNVTGTDCFLPTHVRPTHYKLVIETNLESNPPTFSGDMIVYLHVDSECDTITFNAHPSLKINYLTVSAKGVAGYAVPVDTLTTDAAKERVSVNLGKFGSLKPATEDLKVFIAWEAELQPNLTGYYISTGDPDENGKKQIYALTKFEPTAARRAFPCWDEPVYKATYQVVLIARKEDTVLSNMPVAWSEPMWPESPDGAAGDEMSRHADRWRGWIQTTFETTPPVSTYLIAWACGPFAHLSSEYQSTLSGRTIPLRIYATQSLIKQAQLALDVMRLSLPIYEEMFDIAYPLPKLDTLVVHDFGSAAMENWGLIIAKATAYLYDPATSSLNTKRSVCETQCHEVAHMWFGNIVTMKWWDNLWLNEAFATLMGSLVLPERLWPEWNPRDQFLNTNWVSALNLDSLRSSHPIEMPCHDTALVNQIFDSISYAKGAAVLRMLMAVVGERVFLKGVSIYLKKHLYANAETRDLWAGISEAVGRDVTKEMANWTLKVGFPVLTVEEVGEGKLKITQNRFLSTADVKPEEDETIWWVPLEIKSMKDGATVIEHNAILAERSATFTVDTDTFKLNAETIGVYRVLYTPERLAKLGRQAQLFSVADRVGLMSDASALAAAGYAKVSGALNLVNELASSENEYLPIARVSGLLARLSDVWWEDHAVWDAIQRLRCKLFGRILDRLGYEYDEDEATEVKQLRTLAVTVAVQAGDEKVVAELKPRFELFMKTGDSSRIPPDLRGSIFATGIRYGGLEEYEKALEVSRDSPNPSLRVTAMSALCATRVPELLDRTFGMLSDPDAVKDQHLMTFFNGLSANRISRHRTLQYLMENWDLLNERFSSNDRLKGSIRVVLTLLSSKADLERIKLFFANKDISKYRLLIEQRIDAIQSSADWLERDDEDLRSWLGANGYLQER